jgi:hypothetical protein
MCSEVTISMENITEFLDVPLDDGPVGSYRIFF